jgi:arylsulfatase A-like enzyme
MRPAIGLVVFGALIAPSFADAPPRPDIVLILADDLGLGDLGCYSGRAAETPNLDRMAGEGIRFTRYYAASPICSPSRCGLLTGQFPARWRITSYLQTRAGNRACEQADFLDPKAPTLPRTLKTAGYATAHVGKWHLGGGRDVRDAPKFAAYGYDVGYGTWESPEPHPDITAGNWIWSANDKVKRWERTGWMVDRALDFLKAHPDQPCFVNLWFDDPHTPWVPSANDQTVGENGRAAGKKNTRPRLQAVLQEMDRQVGRLLDACRSRDGRPTLVLFVSDNGPMPSFNRERTRGLRGSKLSLYEGGVRLPFIAWGAGVPAGKVDESTVLAAVDLFPTLCKLAGAELLKGYAPDGENMSAALLGKPGGRSRPLFWEYGRNDRSFSYPPSAADRSPNVAVLDGDWKLLVNADGNGQELYDLARDPGETTNRAADEPAKAARMTAEALEWRREML